MSITVDQQGSESTHNKLRKITMANNPNQLPNTFAFIDSQNLNLGTQRVGWKLDWRKFRKFLADKYGVTQAYMFIGYMTENVQLYEYMHDLGYLVVLKPTLDIASHKEAVEPTTSSESNQDKDKEKEKEKEKTPLKGNVDAELVLYAMKELPNYEKAIIVSGDGDFFSLAEYLENEGKLSTIMAPNWQYSSLLKPFEEKIVRLDKLRNQLSYKDHRKTKNK